VCGQLLIPRERVDHTYFLVDHTYSFFTVLPLPSPEKVCVVKLLIRSILVLLFNFEVPLKKISKKVAAKKKQKQQKKATAKKRLCVCFPFFCVVVLCDYLCVQDHVSSTV
jgi:uncharacterized membrane protein